MAPLELQLHPEYRAKRGIEAILGKVPTGFDDFVTEKYQDQVEAIFREWSSELLASPTGTDAFAQGDCARLCGRLPETRSGARSSRNIISKGLESAICATNCAAG